jgi:hypothetical protein
MDIRRISLIVVIGALGLLLFACDMLGGDPQVPPVPVPGAPGVPGVAPPVPGQPAIPGAPVPGQPALPPVPGQPVVPPVPGVPVPPVPGQPAVPGAPVPPVPGQPAVPGAPVPPPVAAAPTPPTPTGDELTDALNKFKFEKAQDKKETSMLLTPQSITKGKEQAYEVMLPGTPYCHSFIAVGEEKIKNIDLKLESPEGAVVGKDATIENKALLDYCATTPGTYKLTVAMPGEAGDFAIQVFSKGGAS